MATAFLRMTLDHDTGGWREPCCAGRFAGMRLEELGPADCLALLRECRAEDEEGARGCSKPISTGSAPIGATSWPASGAGGAEGAPAPGRAGGDMTVEEAYAILGLAPGADAEAIKEAHRRLMVKLHPDHGGSDYLATKINRARDVLLHR